MRASNFAGRAAIPAILLLAFLFGWPAPVRADPPMTFRLVETSPWARSIFAAGEIAADTPHVFESFLQANGIRPPATVFLFSGGGDLDAGLALGREIRKAGFDTEVGVPRPGMPARAECDSSCTFVFLGGVTRTMAPGSLYGVHRFSGDLADPLQAAQKKAGELVAYIAEMGVSPGMYTEMTEGSPAQVKYLDAATMARLGITTAETVRGRMAFDADTPVLVVEDQQGEVNYGRIDFFCRGPDLMARGYFRQPDAPLDPAAMALDWIFFKPGAASSERVAVPAEAAAVAGTTGREVMVDVYVPPGVLFNGILKSRSVWLGLGGAGIATDHDIIGIGATKIPAGVKDMLQTLARAC